MAARAASPPHIVWRWYAHARRNGYIESVAQQLKIVNAQREKPSKKIMARIHHRHGDM